jgi:hypothetical protein
VKIVLPVLGVNLLRGVATRPARPGGDDSAAGVIGDASPIFQMNLSQHGVLATAQEFDGEFTVHEGSQARNWTGTDHSYRRFQERLVADGTLVPSADNSTMLFARAYVFSSPSGAAAMVAGRTANGRKEWKVQESGKSYADWQTEGIDSALTEDPQ